MAYKCSSSRLTPSAPFFSHVSNKREPFSFFYKPPTSNIIPCCTTYDSPSSSSSSSSPAASYNPLNRRPFGGASSPEISRHWVEADQPNAYQGERFTVVSYNILADRNALKHKDLYTDVNPLYLKWAHRKKLICDELIGLNPDIICLQEVDKYFDLLMVMEKAGYAGTFKGRTGGNVDGCAMFWKADKLRLLEGESIEFKALGLRDNVAQLSVFETCKAEPRRLLVGNIHVLYNPSRGEVKLGQIRNLLSRAQILAEKWGDVPVILAGDFNSTPKLDVMLYSRREMSGQRNCHPPQVFGVEKEMSNPLSLMEGFLNCWSDEELKTATGDSNYNLVTHALKLKSSYATVKGSTRTRDLTGEPVATSYHSKFLGTVDYLWYSDGVVPIRVLDTLSFDILRKTGGLPSKELGSDHLALVSEFVFIPGASEGSHLITDELT
ncbi:carbon catabolite repressor protein 4 homolog 3 isoform X2 [Mercurialis annua]|uniref:carbon catabolite repressor protein 4 homolog 3 isoform X2 n=1 Tax=Mercurialis annua TaxID=3986 RepID=UPI002160A814|nr:carbon catabolite repressor protein 4 homolog 3 isoform X2 [Mercurialis annua]